MDSAEEVSQRIGDQIRRARQSRGMTLGALSEAAGLSTAFLSRLERGEASTSIANLIRIAGSLRIPLHDMFDGHSSQHPTYVLVKRDVRKASPMLSAAGYTYERLGGDLAGQRLDAFELEFPVGARREILLVAHEGEEVLFLLSGRIEFQIGAERFVMEEGDCLHFDAEQPHMGRNIGTEPARMLMVVSPSRSARSRFGWWEAEAAAYLPPASKQRVAPSATASGKRGRSRKGVIDE
jgi:transcriptional regulator with XRE-family HTH domain